MSDSGNTQIRTLGVIPARFASTRFPGKPLVDVLGKPMVVRVMEQARKCKSLSRVIVATDDERIKTVVEDAGGEAILTGGHHVSGTDRMGEVAKNLPDFEVYVNIQGDEPFIDPEHIDAAIVPFISRKDISIVTLTCPATDTHVLHSPTSAKVTVNTDGFALYFSRQAIPFLRSEPDHSKWVSQYPYKIHIGLYAFRKAALHRIISLPPSGLESAESLEQLRWLENGFKIFTVPVNESGLSVDTPEDLKRAIEKYGRS